MGAVGVGYDGVGGGRGEGHVTAVDDGAVAGLGRGEGNDRGVDVGGGDGIGPEQFVVAIEALDNIVGEAEVVDAGSGGGGDEGAGVGLGTQDVAGSDLGRGETGGAVDVESGAGDAVVATEEGAALGPELDGVEGARRGDDVIAVDGAADCAAGGSEVLAERVGLTASGEEYRGAVYFGNETGEVLEDEADEGAGVRRGSCEVLDVAGDGDVLGGGQATPTQYQYYG